MSMIESMVSTWTDVMEGLIGMINSAQALFWNQTDSTFTFLGLCCLVSVAVGIALLIVGIIQNFVHLRS